MRHIEPARSVSVRSGAARRTAAPLLPVILLLAAALSFLRSAHAEDAAHGTPWLAGAYSFSDELGGFRIRSVTGSGTKADPVVIGEELYSASPVTLAIRATKPVRAFDFSGDYANGFVHMRLEVLNASERAWVEFEFELQEILDLPSTYGDGLSFDQGRSDANAISSDSFADFSRDFEPYDRLLFRNGKIDPRQTDSFGFLITDYTPTNVFYLVQYPRIPST
ncbi:hypothetical protein [Mesorhizobium sp. KR1-2]|uniref:hypothetical protein n=1 Tax=Mesorhizobium sp. KR1-2 TaxID=3156609 RepID=UPI0032B4EA92